VPRKDDPCIPVRVDAIRGKPKASINVMCDLVKKGEADVAISAGNTGACVAAAQLKMRTLPGVSRPGIAVILPTFHGPVVICDVGANPEPKPKHLEQYAMMAGAYASAICGIENPRVGLLSIGEEDAKGNSLTKESRKLMRDEPQINFIGNIEGRDLFKGAVDVVVCDGFVGNIILKFTEGIAEGLFQTIMAELAEFAPDLLEQFKPVMKKIYHKHDWQEYGGAPLLGVGGYCLICHGRSDSRLTMRIRIPLRDQKLPFVKDQTCGDFDDFHSNGNCCQLGSANPLTPSPSRRNGRQTSLSRPRRKQPSR